MPKMLIKVVNPKEENARRPKIE